MRLNTDNFTLQFYTITSGNIYGFIETYRTDSNFLRNVNKIKEIFIQLSLAKVEGYEVNRLKG